MTFIFISYALLLLVVCYLACEFKFSLTLTQDQEIIKGIVLTLVIIFSFNSSKGSVLKDNEIRGYEYKINNIENKIHYSKELKDYVKTLKTETKVSKAKSEPSPLSIKEANLSLIAAVKKNMNQKEKELKTDFFMGSIMRLVFEYRFSYLRSEIKKLESSENKISELLNSSILEEYNDNIKDLDYYPTEKDLKDVKNKLENYERNCLILFFISLAITALLLSAEVMSKIKHRQEKKTEML